MNDLRLKIQPSGHIGHLLKGAVRLVAISYSQKSGEWNIRYFDRSMKPDLEEQALFALDILKAYKDEADKLETLRQACMIVFNK